MPHDADEPAQPLSLTSTSLIERVRARDQDAWQRLVELYGPLVYGWCRGWGVEQCDSQDVVQEVFRAVISAIDGFRKNGSSGTFRGWLWTIAKNRAKAHFSQRARHPRAIGGTDILAVLEGIPEQYSEDSLGAAVSGDAEDLLRRAVGILQSDFQERTWRAFLRTAVDGAKACDVAAELKMTTRAVRQARHRVLQRLREEFRGLID